MASSFSYISFSCIVFLAMQQMATGLDCYVCSSCTSPTGLTTVASGASGYSCTKYTVMLLGSVSSVARSYIATGSCTEYNSVSSGTGVIYNCCTTDGCNTGTALSSSFILAFALIAIIGVLKKTMDN